MSLFVIAIGAAHALPSLIGAAVSKKKTGVILGAAIGCLLGFLSGNPAFIAADLIGVGIGTWIGLSMVESK